MIHQIYRLLPKLKDSSLLKKFRKQRNIHRLTKKLLYDAKNYSEECTEEFLHLYSPESPMLDLKGKKVVYIVDQNGPRLGLSDRLRGAVFVYKCVKELKSNGVDVEFAINFTSPFSLDTYLVPNTYNWKIATQDVSFNSTQSEVISLGCLFTSKGAHGLAKYLKNRVENSSHNQIHIYTNALLTHSYSQLFNELFRPSDIIQKELDIYTQKLNNEKYISATFRFQNLLGDFNEGDNYPALENSIDQERLIDKCLLQLDKLRQKNRNQKILVTSDSKRFLEKARQVSSVFIIEGDLVHMAFTDSNSIDLHKKSFVDFLMIARAEKIHLLQTGKMYRSCFPYIASLINKRPFKEIRF